MYNFEAKKIEKLNREKHIAIQVLSIKIINIIKNNYNDNFNMFIKDNYRFDLFLKNNNLDGVNTHFNLTQQDFDSIINTLKISYQANPNLEMNIIKNNVENVDNFNGVDLSNQKSKQYTKNNGRKIQLYE